MPGLDALFNKAGSTGPTTAQCFEADVLRVDERGVFVAIPGYAQGLAWGPCLPRTATATVGDRVVVAMSNAGRPWLMGAGGAEDPNIDGGAPDSIYEPNPGIDGGDI